MPQKITARYSRIRAQMAASDTRRKTWMPSRHRKARTFSTTVRAAMRTKEARALSRKAASSRWPKRMENTAPLPIQSPSRMEVRKVISVKEEPTAARASGPRYQLTISVSATL